MQRKYSSNEIQEAKKQEREPFLKEKKKKPARVIPHVTPQKDPLDHYNTLGAPYNYSYSLLSYGKFGTSISSTIVVTDEMKDRIAKKQARK